MYTVACALREKGLLGYQKSDETRVGAAETESLFSAGSYCSSKYFVFVNIILYISTNIPHTQQDQVPFHPNMLVCICIILIKNGIF